MAIQDSGGHWYAADGTARHTIIGKNGKERAPNIKDARSLRLLPSVTTVAKDVLAQPRNLVTWSYRQVALAALTYPKKPEDVLDDAYLDKVIDGAFQQTRDAADVGQEVHDALEKFFSDQPHDPKFDMFVNAVADWTSRENVHIIQRELTLVNAAEGYAGRTDAIIDSARGVSILDYKTRKSKPEYKMTPWEDNLMQVAAYYVAKFGPITDQSSGVNLLISVTEPGRVEATWYAPNELRDGWEIFRNVMAIWRLKKGYDPRTPA